MDRLEEGACVLIFVVMTAVALVNVVTRYVVRYALAFTEEVVVSLFVWLTLLGAAIAFRQGAQLTFSYLVDRAPARLRRLLLGLSTLASVGLFATLAYFGWRQVQIERLLGTTTEALALPQWWYTAGIPVLSLWVIVRVVQAAARTPRRPNPPAHP